MEEAKRDKALKQVVESSFWEKAQEVSRMEKKAITVEKSRDIANCKFWKGNWRSPIQSWLKL